MRLAAADKRIDVEGDNEAAEEANELFDKLLVDVMMGSGGLFCLGEWGNDLVILCKCKKKKREKREITKDRNKNQGTWSTILAVVIFMPICGVCVCV